MAIKTVPRIGEKEGAEFERELLAVLKKDKDHQLTMDGLLRVRSRRYRCDIKAGNVFWDEKRNDIVLVGAILQGEPVYDMSRGYPILKKEIEIPFSEILQDLAEMPGADPGMLVSKVRKAAMDKYIVRKSDDIRREEVKSTGEVRFSDYEMKSIKVNNNRSNVDSISVDKEGNVELVSENGLSVSVSRMSISDMQRIGDRLSAVKEIYSAARHFYLQARLEAIPKGNRTLSGREDVEGAKAGLRAVNQMDIPRKVCHDVAKTFYPTMARLFSNESLSAKEVDVLIKNFKGPGQNPSIA